MSNFEWTRIDNQASRDAFDFWERVSHSNDAKPPLGKATIKSWVVGGERSPGSVMVQKLPVEIKRVRGLPVYYEPAQMIWFVDGYPDNFLTEAEATAFAESLVPAGSEIPPVNPLPDWATPLIGFGALIAMLV